MAYKVLDLSNHAKDLAISMVEWIQNKFYFSRFCLDRAGLYAG